MKKEYVYRCQHCKKAFDSELEAKEHLKNCEYRRETKKEESYECEKCSNKFKTLKEAERHEKICKYKETKRPIDVSVVTILNFIGGLFQIATFGIILLIAGIGLIYRKNWARILQVLIGWAMIFSGIAVLSGTFSDLYDPIILGISGIVFGCLYVYVFGFQKSVLEYFGVEKESKPWYKRWWAIVLFVFIAIMILSFLFGLATGIYSILSNSV